jgi:hypothetical protein
MVSAYQHYLSSQDLAAVLQQDALARFNGKIILDDLPGSLANCSALFIEIIAASRNLAWF